MCSKVEPKVRRETIDAESTYSMDIPFINIS